MAHYKEKEDLIQLIKRFGEILTLKISNLFNNLDSRSIGAIAGLAIAIVFTWRLYRSSKGPQSTQSKQQAPTSTRNSDITTTLLSSKDNSKLELLQPVQTTLGHLVKQRLSDGRKVTCQLLGVILEEDTPEELQNQATVKSSALEVLLEITKLCDIYLMETVLDDESEEKVLAALEDAGVFTSGGLIKDKVLFSSTEIARISFVRQLEPDWHIDTNPDIVSQLARFIKYELYITPIDPERTAPNVYFSTSLERYFGCV